MAKGTFTGIRVELDGAVDAIDAALGQRPLDIPAVRRELDRLRALSKRIEVIIGRLCETWG